MNRTLSIRAQAHGRPVLALSILGGFISQTALVASVGPFWMLVTLQLEYGSLAPALAAISGWAVTSFSAISGLLARWITPRRAILALLPAGVAYLLAAAQPPGVILVALLIVAGASSSFQMPTMRAAIQDRLHSDSDAPEDTRRIGARVQTYITATMQVLTPLAVVGMALAGKYFDASGGFIAISLLLFASFGLGWLVFRHSNQTAATQETGLRAFRQSWTAQSVTGLVLTGFSAAAIGAVLLTMPADIEQHGVDVGWAWVPSSMAILAGLLIGRFWPKLSERWSDYGLRIAAVVTVVAWLPLWAIGGLDGVPWMVGFTIGVFLVTVGANLFEPSIYNVVGGDHGHKIVVNTGRAGGFQLGGMLAGFAVVGSLWPFGYEGIGLLLAVVGLVLTRWLVPGLLRTGQPAPTTIPAPVTAAAPDAVSAVPSISVPAHEEAPVTATFPHGDTITVLGLPVPKALLHKVADELVPARRTGDIERVIAERFHGFTGELFLDGPWAHLRGDDRDVTWATTGDGTDPIESCQLLVRQLFERGVEGATIGGHPVDIVRLMSEPGKLVVTIQLGGAYFTYDRNALRLVRSSDSNAAKSEHYRAALAGFLGA